MNEATNQFKTLLQEEHREMSGALKELADAFWWRVPEYFPSILRKVTAMTDPHFRCKEKVLLPALEEVLGKQRVSELLAEHNQRRGSADQLAELANKEVWSDEEVGAGIHLIQELLQHVTDCDVLIDMVEQLPDETVRNILDAHKHFNQATTDLVRWAQEVKNSPASAAR